MPNSSERQAQCAIPQQCTNPHFPTLSHYAPSLEVTNHELIVPPSRAMENGNLSKYKSFNSIQMAACKCSGKKNSSMIIYISTLATGYRTRLERQHSSVHQSVARGSDVLISAQTTMHLTAVMSRT